MVEGGTREEKVPGSPPSSIWFKNAQTSDKNPSSRVSFQSTIETDDDDDDDADDDDDDNAHADDIYQKPTSFEMSRLSTLIFRPEKNQVEKRFLPLLCLLFLCETLSEKSFGLTAVKRF